MDGDAAFRLSPGKTLGYSARLPGDAPAQLRPLTEPARREPDRDRDRRRDDDRPHHDKDGDKPDDDKAGAEKPPMPRWKKLLYWGIGILVVAALITGGVLYWLHARNYETTDDAFIDGHISQVSAQVAGRVLALKVDDNQQVAAGQELAVIDPRDFDVRLKQARAQRSQAAAQLEQARAQLSLQRANLDQSAANVRVNEADLGQATADLSRFRAVDPRAISRQQVDTGSAAVRTAQARLDASRQAVEGARAQIEAGAAQVDAAAASLEAADATIANAELQLSYTRILAPVAGRVTRRTVEVGNYVNPGQALLAVVPAGMWVTANFKETQLALMQAGQKVRVRVDACPDLDLAAHVDSFQAGSGSAFSSLPAENATGNYVKVVQRVPVKVVFDDDRENRDKVGQCRMAPGMSVAPRVTVRRQDG